MWVFKVLSYTLKTRFLDWQRLFSYFYILLVLMKNVKLLVPNMFSVLIFKHSFSNLPLDYKGRYLLRLIFSAIYNINMSFEESYLHVKNLPVKN